MPVENEIKFVMRMRLGLEDAVAKKADKVYSIEQGYLPSGGEMSVRIRRQCDRSAGPNFALGKNS